jgi:hypothetical protein
MTLIIHSVRCRMIEALFITITPYLIGWILEKSCDEAARRKYEEMKKGKKF